MSDNHTPPPEGVPYTINSSSDPPTYVILEVPPEAQQFAIPPGYSALQRDALVAFAHRFRTVESLARAYTHGVWRNKNTSVVYHVWMGPGGSHVSIIQPNGYVSHDTLHETAFWRQRTYTDAFAFEQLHPISRLGMVSLEDMVQRNDGIQKPLITIRKQLPLPTPRPQTPAASGDQLSFDMEGATDAIPS